MCRDFAAASGARITVTDDPVKAVTGVDFIYRRVGIDGRATGNLGERIDMLLPFRSTPS